MGRTYTYPAQSPPDWTNPDPRLTNTNYNYRVYQINFPSNIFLTFYQPPVGLESNLLPIVGDMIKIQGDPRTWKIEQIVPNSTAGPLANAFDILVEMVSDIIPESNVLYPYEDIVFEKIF